MKPFDIESAILRVLAAARRHATAGMTIHHLHRRMSPASGGGPIWRQVANAVYRLERAGLVHINGDETVGGVSHPLFAVTPAGEKEAERVASLAPGGFKPVQEVSHG